MTDYLFQMRLGAASGLPEDVFENVLCFDVAADPLPGGDTPASVCEELVDLYMDGALGGGGNIIGGVKTYECRAYALGGGFPVASFGPVTGAVKALHVPTEVAVCLSYAAEDDPSKVGPRRRGRIYVGPLTFYGGERPTPTDREYVLDFGERLAQIGTGLDVTWKLYSRTDDATFKIESIWCDDAWDTQRRRGFAPTTREVRDVQ